MFSLEWDNSFNLKMKCELQTPVDKGEKLVILSEFSKAYGKYEKFSSWMDNPDVSIEQKKPYERNLLNGQASLQFIYEFMKACRITKEEIKEYAELPF
jgi:hypothetical protein